MHKPYQAFADPTSEHPEDSRVQNVEVPSLLKVDRAKDAQAGLAQRAAEPSAATEDLQRILPSTRRHGSATGGRRPPAVGGRACGAGPAGLHSVESTRRLAGAQNFSGEDETSLGEPAVGVAGVAVGLHVPPSPGNIMS